MSITPLPSPPEPTDSTSQFNTKAFAWVAALDTWTTEANALTSTVNALEDSTIVFAGQAQTAASQAAASATASANSATTALGHASAAAANTNAPLWVSGTTYAAGALVYSSVDGRTYRRKTAGSGTTNPASDPTNWTPLLLEVATLRPTIRPSLNLDFANTKQLDSRITFSRASSATYYGTQTAKAEENLLIRSQEFDNAVWLKTNASITADNTSAPDGTTTADTVTFSAAGGGQNARQQLTLIVGATYTFSVFLKGVAGETVTLEMDTISTVITLSASWDRYSVSGVNANASTAVRIVSRSGNTATVFDAWGAQLEQRSAVTAYTPTTTQPITNYIPVLETASANVARFDHDPVTGESLGLLVEEQRTNLVVRSEEFDNAAWSKVRSSIVSNTIIAPDGTLTGDKLVEDTTASSSHYFTQNVTVPSAGATASVSLYVKAAGRSRVLLWIQNSADRVFAKFNLSTLTFTSGALVNGSFTSAEIQAVGNNWYRVNLVGSLAGKTLYQLQVQLVDNSDNDTYTGDGYSGIYIWGAQLE